MPDVFVETLVEWADLWLSVGSVVLFGLSYGLLERWIARKDARRKGGDHA